MEMLLCVVIIGILAGISLPLYQRFQNRNDVDVAAESVVYALRRAQAYSRGAKGGTSWGVALQTGSGTLFQGVSYATRDPAFDELIAMPSNMTAAGLTEVVFNEFTANPVSTGV